MMTKIPPYKANSHPSNKHTPTHTIFLPDRFPWKPLYPSSFHVIFIFFSIVRTSISVCPCLWVRLKQMMFFSLSLRSNLRLLSYSHIPKQQHLTLPNPSVCFDGSLSVQYVLERRFLQVCACAVVSLRQASIIRKTDHLTQAVARRLNLDPTGSSRLRALSQKKKQE